MTDAEIISRIRQYMTAKNMSVNMLAQKSDIAQSTLSSMMNRENLPSLPTLVKICNGLNITLSQFFFDPNEPDSILTPKQNELLSVYNSLSEQNQHLLQTIAVDILEHQKKNRTASPAVITGSTPFVTESEERMVAETTEPYPNHKTK